MGVEYGERSQEDGTAQTKACEVEGKWDPVRKGLALCLVVVGGWQFWASYLPTASYGHPGLRAKILVFSPIQSTQVM